MSAQFYELDSSRVSLREYSFGTSWLLMPLIWLLKLLRIRLPGSSDDPPVESLAPFRARGETLPPEVLQKFREPAGRLANLGFHSPTFYVIEDRRQSTRICWVTWQHTSGQVWARQQYRHWSGTKPPREHLFCTFITSLSDGRYALTTSGKPDLLAPAAVVVRRSVGTDEATLYETHQRTMREEFAGTSPRSLVSPDDVAAAEESLHIQIRDFHVARGVFRPVPVVAEIFVPTASGVEVVATGFRHPEVLVELAQLQNKRVGWGNVLIVLLVSMGLFTLAGMKDHKVLTLATLVGVVFFHEMGHYVAMRLFGYRNLRMFFVPFLGAAVSGQNYNVAGWKKAIVSLMGPVPGIAGGIVAGIAGMALGIPSLISLACVAVALNGFNLLPLLPLDGGWVLHATLFCRHPVLNVGFKLLAAVALIFAGVMGLGIFFAVWGGLMLMGLPLAYRLARIAAELRTQGVPTHSVDAQTIPAEAAVRIVDALQGVLPAGQNSPKLLAQHTLNIFETLNAHPPGWPATLGLLTVHGGSFLAACVILPFLVISQHSNLGDFFEAAANRPQYALVEGDTETWRGADATPGGAGPHRLLIGHYADSQAAGREFANWSTRLGPQARATRVGPVLILSLPQADEKADRITELRLRSQCRRVVVDQGDGRVTWRLLGIAPSSEVAETLVARLDAYWETQSNSRPNARSAPWDLAPRAVAQVADAQVAGAEDAGAEDAEKGGDVDRRAVEGFARNVGPIVRLEQLEIRHPDETLPALIAWLLREKCVDLRFEVDEFRDVQ